MRLGDLIEQLHFKNAVEAQTFRFRSQLFKVFRVKRTEKSLPEIVFSEYFFVEVSETAMSMMTEDDDLSYFRDFQTKLLSNTFFSYKNDVRWNLYLILVIEEYEIIKDNSMLQKIENDADYARKFVATPADVLKWLDKEWLHTAAEDISEEVDPLQEWTDHLEPVQLTGCLTQPFATQYVNQYLAGQPFISAEVRPSARRGQNYDEYEEKIETINTICFDGFRNHCFAHVEPILPTTVNLLHGPNGSGKTSAMEAIEYALTNDIRRCSEFGDKLEETAETFKVMCTTASQQMLSFQPGKPVALYKKLAQAWYGVPTGRQSELNYYFHRFNYFDSEAAYRFALNESGRDETEKFDYSDNFSRLVFGDTVIETQKKWQRYKQEFDEQLKALTKQQNEITSTIRKLNEQISTLSRTEQEQSIDLDTLLKSIRLNELNRGREAGESTLEYLERLAFLLKSVEPRRKEIIEFPSSIVTLSLEHIQLELQQQKDKLNLLIQEKDSKLAQQEQLELELDRFRSELQKIEDQNLDFKQSLDSISRILMEWQGIRKIIETPSQVDLRRELENRAELLTKKLDALQRFEAKYSRVLSLTNTELSLLSHAELQELQKNLEGKEVMLIQLKNQLEAAEKFMDQVSTLLSRLHHLGKDFLELEQHSTVCPLCKHEHGTHNALASAIHSAMSVNEQGESNIDNLRRNVDLLKTETESLRERMAQHDKKKRNREQVTEAYNELINYLIFDISASLQSPEEQLQAIKALFSAQVEWNEQRVTVQKQLQVLDETGFRKETIIQAELFQKENEMYREFTEQQSSASFEEHVIIRQKDLQKEMAVTNNLLERLQKHIADLQQRLQQFSFKELDLAIEDQEKQIESLQRFTENMESLFTDFDLEGHDNLRVWAIQLQKALTQIDLLLEKLRSQQQEVQLQSELAEANKELDVLKNQYERCVRACTALEQLRPLKTFTEQFIGKNITKIERFFKMLHTPREFDELILEKEGLTLLRKWDGKKVKAFQMSSGQRASLALSVMFAVHLAAPSAPKFIIMDEPVANMDDLHLMNLLDLLRDLALSGRQIFFTTANPDVANLFRRKFSFFQEQFTHFEFTRHSGEPVHIRSIKYTPYMESPLSQIS
ncbi:ABC-three component system middle component 1 [Cohnella algarum]|uniref:ABC-three component system middle component 1 n=1 Tax=Cohnella algarum TaxID=2044859 RepID=UPI0019683B50|nr:ABC-three component system middle component 1 [Cohnella algarum]MBN2981852.1 AAA family ATPase [Cohnella algarum]